MLRKLQRCSIILERTTFPSRESQTLCMTSLQTAYPGRHNEGKFNSNHCKIEVKTAKEYSAAVKSREHPVEQHSDAISLLNRSVSNLFNDNGESIEGNKILDRYVHMQMVDEHCIQNVMESLSDDMIACGLPYLVNNINYQKFMNNAMQKILNFPSDDILYLANLDFHIENKRKKTSFDTTLKTAFRIKMTEYTIMELKQLTELLLNRRPELYYDLLFDILFSFERKTLNIQELALLTFEDLCEISKMCVLMPVPNTDKFFNYVLSRKSDNQSLSSAYYKLYMGMLSSNQLSTSRIFNTYPEKMYSLERAMKKIHEFFIIKSREFSPDDLVNIVYQSLPMYNKGIQFFLSKDICKEVFNMDDKLLTEIGKKRRCEIMLSHFELAECRRDLVDNLKKFIRPEASKFNPYLYVDVVSFLGSLEDHSNRTSPHIRIPPDPYNMTYLEHVEWLFNLLELNILTQKIVDNFMNIKITMIKAKEGGYRCNVLHKICLLIYALEIKKSSIAINLPHEFSNMLKLVNESLVNEVGSKKNSAPNETFFQLIPRDRCYSRINFDNVGVIDYLLIFDKNGLVPNSRLKIDHTLHTRELRNNIRMEDDHKRSITRMIAIIADEDVKHQKHTVSMGYFHLYLKQKGMDKIIFTYK